MQWHSYCSLSMVSTFPCVPCPSKYPDHENIASADTSITINVDFDVKLTLSINIMKVQSTLLPHSMITLTPFHPGPMRLAFQRSLHTRGRRGGGRGKQDGLNKYLSWRYELPKDLKCLFLAANTQPIWIPFSRFKCKILCAELPQLVTVSWFVFERKIYKF